MEIDNPCKGTSEISLYDVRQLLSPEEFQEWSFLCPMGSIGTPMSVINYKRLRALDAMIEDRYHSQKYQAQAQREEMKKVEKIVIPKDSDVDVSKLDNSVGKIMSTPSTYDKNVSKDGRNLKV